MIREQFRKLRYFIAVIVFAAAGVEVTANANTNVTGYISCDNYWALYYQPTPGGPLTYSGHSGAYPGTGPSPSGTGPFSFTIPTGSQYIYVLAWSDRAVAQGFVATLKTAYSADLQTGTAPWMVAPRALNVTLNGPQTAPNLTTYGPLINLSLLNWTSPSVGPPNSLNPPAKPWQVLSGLTASHWIWYRDPSANPACLSGTGSPLVPGCNHGEPLLFRLPVEAFKPCLRVVSDRTPCCVGRDSKGNPIYSFSATVTNPSAGAAPLTVSGPTGVTILSYGPGSIPPGNSVVWGTFTVAGAPPSPFCLDFEITLPNIVDNSGGGDVSTERQADSFADRDVKIKSPLKVKCRGPLCFRKLPPPC